MFGALNHTIYHLTHVLLVRGMVDPQCHPFKLLLLSFSKLTLFGQASPDHQLHLRRSSSLLMSCGGTRAPPRHRGTTAGVRPLTASLIPPDQQLRIALNTEVGAASTGYKHRHLWWPSLLGDMVLSSSTMATWLNLDRVQYCANTDITLPALVMPAAY